MAPPVPRRRRRKTRRYRCCCGSCCKCHSRHYPRKCFLLVHIRIYFVCIFMLRKGIRQYADHPAVAPLQSKLPRSGCNRDKAAHGGVRSRRRPCVRGIRCGQRTIANTSNTSSVALCTYIFGVPGAGGCRQAQLLPKAKQSRIDRQPLFQCNYLLIEQALNNPLPLSSTYP